jgi:UDP-glucuronate decarboxylase
VKTSPFLAMETRPGRVCYRDDLVEGILRLMESPDDFTGPVNLGNPDEFSIRQLADLVLTMTGSSSQLIYQDLPIDDPHRRQPDIALAKRVLQWEPTVPLREGLQQTVDWFRTIDWVDYRPPTPNY